MGRNPPSVKIALLLQSLPSNPWLKHINNLEEVRFSGQNLAAQKILIDQFAGNAWMTLCTFLCVIIQDILIPPNKHFKTENRELMGPQQKWKSYQKCMDVSPHPGSHFYKLIQFQGGFLGRGRNKQIRQTNPWKAIDECAFVRHGDPTCSSVKPLKFKMILMCQCIKIDKKKENKVHPKTQGHICYWHGALKDNMTIDNFHLLVGHTWFHKTRVHR